LLLDPHHASAQFGLARAYQQSGQADPAHEAMQKFQHITQNKLGAPISLAYGEQGKYSRAEDSPLAVEKVGAAIPVRFVDVTLGDGLVSKNFSPRPSSLAPVRVSSITTTTVESTCCSPTTARRAGWRYSTMSEGSSKT
jgi:hypothetical protein